jgi:D-alanine-D-alanine ligase
MRYVAQPANPAARTVGVIFGGPSAEAEVSRVSAQAVVQALRAKGHQPKLVAMDRFMADSLRDCEVVFPVAHGGLGEDGSLQGALEWLGIPYVGSRVLASALAMDKWMARTLFERAGLPIAAGFLVKQGGRVDQTTLSALLRSGQGVVVKPRASGSGLGVSRLEEAAATLTSLQKACDDIHATNEDALLESLCPGREVTCAVRDLGSVQTFAPIEVETPNDAFYTFQARYAPGRSVHHCPARLPDAQLREVKRIAAAAHEALGCRHLSRADFMVAEDRLVLLEVNTLPGFTPTSLYPEALAHSGVDFPSLCDEFVRYAIATTVYKSAKAAVFPT